MGVLAKELILGAFADEAGNPIEDQIAAMPGNGIKHLEARTIGDKNFVKFTNAIHMSGFFGHPVELPMDEEGYFAELQKRVATSRRKENVKAVVADTSASYAGAK